MSRIGTEHSLVGSFHTSDQDRATLAALPKQPHVSLLSRRANTAAAASAMLQGLYYVLSGSGVSYNLAGKGRRRCTIALVGGFLCGARICF